MELPFVSVLPDGTLLQALAVFVVAGAVKGVVGLGLPTVAMALLGQLMPPSAAAVLLIVPSLVTNVWQMRPFAGSAPLLRRLAPMLAGACVGTLAGAWWLGAPSGTWATVSLGLALVAYAAWSLAGAKLLLRRRDEAWLGPLAGALTGLVTAATGVFVVPAVPYLQALGLQRDALVQAMGVSFTVSTLALAAGLSFNLRGSAAELGVSTLMLLPALAGMAAGRELRRRLSPALFRLCFLVSLAVLGVHMVARELVLR